MRVMNARGMATPGRGRRRKHREEAVDEEGEGGYS